MPGDQDTVIRVGKRPYGLAQEGNHLWVACDESNQIAIVDTLTLRMEGTLLVEAAPLAMCFDGRNMWLSNDLHNQVQAFDPKAHSVVRAVRVGGFPWSLACDGARLWVASGDGDLLKPSMSIPAGRLLRSQPVRILED